MRVPNHGVRPAISTSPSVRSVAVSPDGSFLAAAGDDGLIRLWDLATGSRRAVLSGASGPVESVAVKSRWLLSLSPGEATASSGSGTRRPVANVRG